MLSIGQVSQTHVNIGGKSTSVAVTFSCVKRRSAPIQASPSTALGVLKAVTPLAESRATAKRIKSSPDAAIFFLEARARELT